MLQTIRHILELIRFSHTVFALPFALFAAVLAWRGHPFRWPELIGILACMVTARSAAMAFNRVVDRDVDQDNPRTARRHIPAGLLGVRAVALFTLVNSLLFIAATLLFLPNRWPVILSVPVLLFLLGYSYAKRWTAWCHYWLSAALMLSPMATWIAIRGTVEWPAVLLAAVIFFWVGGFDILYATQDAKFDRERKLFSIPARYGIPTALRLAAVSHFLTAVCLVGLWWVAGLGTIFLIGIVLIALLLAYEHSLVRPDNLARVNLAFFHVNAVISVGLLVLGTLDVFVAG